MSILDNVSDERLVEIMDRVRPDIGAAVRSCIGVLTDQQIFEVLVDCGSDPVAVGAVMKAVSALRVQRVLDAVPK